MEIITRAEARERGLTRYFNGNPCPRGHGGERFVSSGACCECSAARVSARQEAARLAREPRIPKPRKVNKEAARAATLRWREKNKEHVRATQKRWIANNRQLIN